MSNNQFNLTYTTDLNQGLASTTLPMLFLYDDSLAHVFTVKTTRDGKPNSLDGASVHAYFMPSNSEECVYMAGTVDENGYAVVTLEPACYAFIGRFSLVIRAEKGSAVTSIFRGEGYVGQSHTEAILDPGDALPSLAALEARINALDAAKAPSGYGLGMTAMQGTAIPDCNAAYANGWYLVNGDTANGIGALGVIRVDSVTAQTSSATARILQTIFTTDLHSVAVVVQRACTKGTWGAWEYFNPPMVLGVEYRTTERWNGKAVYAKLIDLGALPNATTKEVWHNIDMVDCLSISVSAKSAAWSFTIPSAYNNETQVMFNPASVTITTTIDRSDYTGYATLKYTKN